MASFLNPVLSFSNGIGELLGGSNYSSIGNLLNLQMDMLENISLKLDVLKESLDFIIENQKIIEEELKATPSKTVSELYKKDIEGLFIILKEKMAAYIIENEMGTITKEKTSLIFDEILRELQLSRARVMIIGGYVNIPLIAMCLHFELLCMVFANQPKSYIQVVLNSYKGWLESLIGKGSELYESLEVEREDAKEFKANLASFYTFNKCKVTEVRNYEAFVPGSSLGKQGPAAGEIFPIMTHARFYDIYFKKFNYKIINDWSDEERMMCSRLIDSGLIEGYEIYSALDVDYASVVDLPVFTFNENSSKNGTAAPKNISLEFVFSGSWNDLINTIDKDLVTADNNNPKILENALIEVQKLKSNGEFILCYASFLQTANDALNAIKIVSHNIAKFNELTALNFYTDYDEIQKLNNRRIDIWATFVNEKINKIEDEESRRRLLAINEKMQQLKNSELYILEQYDQAQREFEDTLPGELWDEISAILEPIRKEIERGIKNTGKEAEIFGQNLSKNLEKGVQDLGKQLERDTQNLGEAISVSVTFVDDQIKSYGKTLSNAEKRLLEGKIIDAVWHLSTDSFKSTDDDLAKSVQNSSLLNTIASAAAAIYGGPAGAAAYAAWYTYKQTNDLALALKTGIISGLTSYATQGINATDGSILQTDELIKRSLATSAIGAVAIAASGGDERAIIDGFLKGTALSLASNYYKSYTAADIEGRAPTQDPVLKLKLDYLGNNNDDYFILRDLEGKSFLKAAFDTKKGEYTFILNDGVETMTLQQLGRNVSVVGIATSSAEGFQVFTETAIPMRLLAGVPYMNDMAYFHDIWCDEMIKAGIPLGTVGVGITIMPAIALTVAGSPTPLLAQIQEAAIKNKEELEKA